MTRNSLVPRPSQPIPAGTMSAPRLQPLILAAPDSQVYITWTWRTVREIGPCQRESLHGPMCTRYFLDDEQVGTHADLSTDVWMRHPVAGAS